MMREDAHELLTEYVTEPGLLKHAYAVEASMRKMAEHFGEDQELWGAVGLLHDFDYQRWPSIEEHSLRGAEILAGRDLLPEEAVQAIKAHNDHHGIARETALARTLFAIDELSSFVVACCLVRPNKDIGTLKVKSVRKKLKDKSFARAVNRDEIRKGATELGFEQAELISLVIEALRPVAGHLGLTCSE